MARVLTVTANTLLDHLGDGDLALGRVTRVEAFTPIAGGKGLNVARVLANHGHVVTACGFAGGTSGRRLIELIAADGIEPALTATIAPTRIGFCVVAPGGGQTAVLESGFAVTDSEVDGLVQTVGEHLVDTDLIIISGSVPDASCRLLYRRLLDAAADAGVPCWVDAYGDAMTAALAGRHPPLLAKPNRQEFASDSAWQRCPEVHLTDGAASIRISHPLGRWRVRPATVDEINPIGSGDCYLAALAHARLSGWDLPQQLRYAAAAGAANARRADVAGIGPADITPLLADTRVQVDDDPP